MFGNADVGEQGVQEGNTYTPLRGPSVEDQRGRCVVNYPHHLGAARQVVQDPVAEGGVCPRVLSLLMSFVDTMVLNAELKSMNSILT